MSSIYSTQIFAQAGVTTDQSFDVPTGLVYILRDLDAYNGGGAGSAEVFLVGSDGQAIAWFRQTPGSDASTFEWRGRQVLEEGQSFGFHVASGTWDLTLSGYVLSSP